MMLAIWLILVLSASIGESRVSFTTSEVLDDVDLKESNMASFRCYAGCRVYSPTQNDKIVIQNTKGNEFGSLADLAKLEVGKFFELPESDSLYWLKNKGTPAPSFVFYAVEKGATNYDTKVLYMDAQKRSVNVSSTSLLTILSSSGAIHFSGFLGDYSDDLPTVHTTGFDSFRDCTPVFKPISTRTIAKTSFPVYSPIATINFKNAGEKAVIISGDPFTKTNTGKDVTSVFVSPGYVGCNNGDDSLYTLLPTNVAGVGSSFTLTDSNGLSVVLDGRYSIANEADALTVSVNGDGKKLFGKNEHYSKTYDVTTVKVEVNWAKKEGSKDNFALQIDVISKSEGTQTTRAPTTTSSGRCAIIGISLITIVASAIFGM